MDVQCLKIVIALLVGVAASALAYQEVIVDGVTWGCTNTCVVTIGANGRAYVSDSKGGRIYYVRPS